MTPCRRRAIFAGRQIPVKEIEQMVVDVPKVGNSKACTKCGKVCERGLFMHMKYCKG